MENYISKTTRSEIIKLGFYQIFGGALGVILIFWFLFRTSELMAVTLVMILVMLLIFIYSIYCGALCLKLKEIALKHSLIIQLLQVIGFAALGLSFTFIAGAYLTVGLDLTDSIELQFGAGVSKFDFTINNQTKNMWFDVNIIAIFIIYRIDKLNQKITREKEMKKIETFSKK